MHFTFMLISFPTNAVMGQYLIFGPSGWHSSLKTQGTVDFPTSMKYYFHLVGYYICSMSQNSHWFVLLNVLFVCLFFVVIGFCCKWQALLWYLRGCTCSVKYRYTFSLSDLIVPCFVVNSLVGYELLMLGMCCDLKTECPLMATVLINCFLAGGIILGGCESLKGPAGRNRFLGVGLCRW